MRIYFIFFLLVFVSCIDDEIEDNEYKRLGNYIKGEELLVGKFSLQTINRRSYFTPINIIDINKKSLSRGKRLFTTNWIPAPASTTGLDGLGPLFNAKSCVSCHPGNGRTKPIQESTFEQTGFLMRLSIPGTTLTGAPKPVPNYGIQLQTNAIHRVKVDGDVRVNFEIIKGKYPDGTSYELKKPNYSLFNTNYGPIPADILTSPRIGNQLIGLGFLNGLSEDEILKNADPHDANNDGISGRANYVWNVEKNKKDIGKFGWKANEPNLKQQVAGAFHGDIGLSNPLFQNQNCSDNEYCIKLPNGNGNSFEVTERGLNDVTLFQSSIAVPVRRNAKDIDVINGRVLFNKINCIGCHKTELKVTESVNLPQLNGTIISPYSDLLLHDMGEHLADNRPDFEANGREWRTQPLWGVGMLETINGHTSLLHDGRARTIEEAILWHGGEASSARNNFINLKKEEREQVIKFVNSL